tara:strand:+ start:1865 stop:2113 length:249 start_codon:yes stop_codon:yes gene_type:complete
MQLQKYLDTSNEKYLLDEEKDTEDSYCQSVLNASILDTDKRYVLSDNNVTKLLHDHGADVKEWEEDSKRYNDPEELLQWLGY